MTRQATMGLGAMLLFIGSAAQAQTIYPINRAEILTGAKFDLKVEFPGAPSASALLQDLCPVVYALMLLALSVTTESVPEVETSAMCGMSSMASSPP